MTKFGLTLAGVGLLTALALSPGEAAAAPQDWRKASVGEVTVSDAAGFARALASARPGQAIVLAPGVYPRLVVRGVRKGGPVIIRSRDAASPAHVAGFQILDSEDIWIQDLLIAPHAAAPQTTGYVVDVRTSRAIGLVASTIRGNVDGNPSNDPNGAYFFRTDNVVFAANELHDLGRGAVFGGTRDVRVSENHLTELRSDGINFAGAHRVEIDNNFFSRFHPVPPDHPDFIQFWTEGAVIEDTHTVLIRDNVMLEGGTASVQAIFISSQVPGRVYRDVRVENNVVYNSSAHGISFYDVIGGRIANNTVVMHPHVGYSQYAPRINLIRTADIEVVANVATRIAEADVLRTRKRDNIETRDVARGTPRHPEQLFVDALAGKDASKASFLPRPGSQLVRPGILIGALAPAATDKP